MLVFDLFLASRFEKVIKKNPTVIESSTRTIDDGDNKQIITTKDMYVYVPKRFEEVGMVKIEDSFRTMGMAAIVVGDNYAVLSVPTFLSFAPTSIGSVTIGEDEYFELLFETNSVFIESTRCFKDSSNAYLLFNEFIAKPNMCSFFSYNDALLCMVKLGSLAKLSLDKTNVATEIIIATIARYDQDLNISLRQALAKDPKAQPVFIGLRNIQYGVTNLPTAIMGSYSDVGIDSLLVNPAKKVEEYERLLRS